MLRFKPCIFIAILLLSISSYGQQRDGSVLERRVTINQQNQTLTFILDQLSWQTGVYFSYNALLISGDKKYSIEASGKSLFTVLNNLFLDQNFKFTELENQVVISQKLPGENSSFAENDSIPIKYFFLSGKLIDYKKGNPIKYASVSVFNKPIGTISNIDGDFILKIHPNNILDTVIISSMGYSQIFITAYKILDEDILVMNPVSIRIKEVKVTATTPSQLLTNIRENLDKNYSNDTKLMTAFYRETVKQDGNYINVSEAIIEILKAPASKSYRDDLVRLLKGRRSPDVKPFWWLNFKLQGGPFTITKLDIIKNSESFIHKEYEELYKYTIGKVIWYNKNPVYVLQFQPISDLVFPVFVGEIYVHRETFAIVHANFHFDKNGLRKAESTMIKKKPKGVKARPSYVNYQVNYQQFNGKWHLANVRASIKFKIRSKRNKINSEYHSVSDLLITDIQPTELKRFTRNEIIKQNDVFVEMINHLDEKFWENYNIIKPDEDLRNAFKID
ncbi:MAG: hypothetical protein HN955_19200 [Prolixibacteraceae bacterium]|jgi:hypothetical protein|nr:hypothetical protein [Prolixibacteraceae bacterium]MBT6004586.1 hypothetical protein [Prolixibacteraceae bacterium]MBT6766246.1 hypothetical protein [Prolixibacteraceae bacterium]MBT7000576.1 hypothetical protein [Prolixibacteraceae bacterium]